MVDNYYQTQLMKDKQKQSLKYSYETLGNLLSSAENFVGLNNQKYKDYNYSTAESYNDLKCEFAWELECFKRAIDSFEKKYKVPYKFPPDCPKEKIEEDIKRYMLRCKNLEDKNMFILMHDIINGKKVDIDFSDLYEKLDRNANNKFDPKKMVSAIGPLNQILDMAEEEADKGNMNFFNRDKAKEKSKEQLKNAFQDNVSSKMKVMIGEKGKIFIKNNLYFFENEFGKNQKYLPKNIDIVEDVFFKLDNAIIYINKIINNYAFAILFETKNIKNIKEKNITIIKKFSISNMDYTYGIIYINGKKFDILLEKNEIVNENEKYL